MKKALTFACALLLTLTFILCIAYGILLHTVNLNDYKHNVNELIYRKTGHHADIIGDLKWALFPSIHLSAKNISIANAQQTQASDLLRVKHVNIKVQLLPLLRQKIKIKSLELDHAELNLIKNEQSNTNTVVEKPPVSQRINRSNKPATTQHTAKPAAALTIAPIRIKHSSISVTQPKTGKRITLSDFNFSSERMHQGESTAISMRFKIQRPGLSDIPVSLKTKLNIDIDKQTLDTKDLLITIANMTIASQLHIKDLWLNPRITGTLSSQKTDLKTLTTTLKGQSTLSGNLSFNADFSSSGKTPEQWLNHLSETGNIVIKNATLSSAYLSEITKKANPLLGLQLKSSHSSSDLSETHVIQNCILSSKLTLTSSKLSADGSGTINLKDQAVHYHVLLKYEDLDKHQNQTRLEMPIDITGTVMSPKLTPDIAHTKTQINLKKIDLHGLFKL